MKYEFTYERLENKFYPTIPLLAGFGDNWVPLNALIDSGASLSIFNSGVGRALGIKIETGSKIELHGIGGKVSAFVHKIKIKIGDDDIEADVAFTDELYVSLNLLGRKDIFENLLILFDERNKKVILEKNKSIL